MLKHRSVLTIHAIFFETTLTASGWWIGSTLAAALHAACTILLLIGLNRRLLLQRRRITQLATNWGWTRSIGTPFIAAAGRFPWARASGRFPRPQIHLTCATIQSFRNELDNRIVGMFGNKTKKVYQTHNSLAQCTRIPIHPTLNKKTMSALLFPNYDSNYETICGISEFIKRQQQKNTMENVKEPRWIIRK